MKSHPATKEARKILKKAGFNTFQVGTLSLHVQYTGREYIDRALIVDIVCSAHEEKAKLDVCWLSDSHPMYAEVSKLHGTVFDFS